MSVQTMVVASEETFNNLDEVHYNEIIDAALQTLFVSW